MRMTTVIGVLSPLQPSQIFLEQKGNGVLRLKLKPKTSKDVHEATRLEVSSVARARRRGGANSARQVQLWL